MFDIGVAVKPAGRGARLPWLEPMLPATRFAAPSFVFAEPRLRGAAPS